MFCGQTRNPISFISCSFQGRLISFEAISDELVGQNGYGHSAVFPKIKASTTMAMAS